MNVLAIIGSNRKNGNTFRAVRVAEKKLKALDADINFEYLFLSDLRIGMCKGCSVCLNKSETLCSHKDDAVLVSRKMSQADGVIFACPTYVANMTGLMKNTIDRLAYYCHRPAFYQKQAMLVSTTGSAGLLQVFNSLRVAVASWGFNVVSRAGVAMKTNSVKEIPSSYIPVIEKAALKLYNALKADKISPKINNLTGFLYNQKKFRIRDMTSFDYHYWKDKGWLEKGCQYYTKAQINPFTYIMSKAIALSIEKTTRKGEKE